MKLLKLTFILLLSLLGGSRASSVPTELLKEFANIALAGNSKSSSAKTAPVSLDDVTYTLVDTSLFMIQLAKTGIMVLDVGIEDPVGPLFDFTYNTSRIECTDAGCVQENIFMEFREPNLGGLQTVILHTDFQLDKLNLTLKVDDFTMGCPGYRHTITNNASGVVRVGEGAVLALRNATYGITADYQLVPEVGIQVSNVDITLNLGEESWTIENRYTVLESGIIIDDGLYQGDLGGGVMDIWRGQYETKPFEEQYEQWAELLLNCGLSGGKSSEACAQYAGSINKYKSLIAK